MTFEDYDINSIMHYDGTAFSIDDIDDRIVSASPSGMIDLLYLDAAALNSTPIHDKIYVDPLDLDEDQRPNQMVKWIVEKELKNDIDYGLIDEGKLRFKLMVFTNNMSLRLIF